MKILFLSLIFVSFQATAYYLTEDVKSGVEFNFNQSLPLRESERSGVSTLVLYRAFENSHDESSQFRRLNFHPGGKLGPKETGCQIERLNDGADVTILGGQDIQDPQKKWTIKHGETKNLGPARMSNNVARINVVEEIFKLTSPSGENLNMLCKSYCININLRALSFLQKPCTELVGEETVEIFSKLGINLPGRALKLRDLQDLQKKEANKPVAVSN